MADAATAVLAPIDDTLDAVGGTPVVRLRRVAPDAGAAVYAKLEFFNPSGSLKDRVAVALLERAWAESPGEEPSDESGPGLRPGGTIVEAGGGSLALALAVVCAVRQYALIVIAPDSIARERRDLLRGCGATVVLTPAADGAVGALRRAEAIARETAGAFLVRPDADPAGARAHEDTTGRELLAAAEAERVAIDAVVVPVGTGATLTGVARAVRPRFPGARIVAVEPAGSAVLSGHPAGPHRIAEIGPGLVPEALDRRAINRVIAVSDADAWAMRARLAREEGLLVGMSSGAAGVAAVAVARELGAGRAVFTVFPDTGERYFGLAKELW